MEQPSSDRKYIDEQFFGRWVIGFFQPKGTTARIGLVLAGLVSLAIFSWASHGMGIPPLAGFDGSLMHHPSTFAAIFAVAILLVATTLIGTVLAGAVRFEAGVFAAAVGLMAISLRSGTMQQVLFESAGRASAYFGLAFELFILGLLLLLTWGILWWIGKLHFDLARNPQEQDERERPPERIGQKLAAFAVQIVLTAVVLMSLCQSTAKYQVLASMAIASFLGAVGAYMSFPARPSPWFWLGPIVLGIIGYCLAASGQVGTIDIGDPTGYFAGLTRPLPIDYASVGTAAALLGYWAMHKFS